MGLPGIRRIYPIGTRWHGDREMEEDTGTRVVRDLMRDFAARTGLDPVTAHPRRYLWTDAFAVCAYLQIFRDSRDSRYRDLALRLVDQVHCILGRHRADDPRRGWISGLSEEEGRRHPTAGGLRIGKPLPERRPDEPPDERREWDQDGQYYHYLTRWMHALNRVAAVTRNPEYLRWALELARAAHEAFTYRPASGGQKRMHWKMSIDLSRPLVLSMGQHDVLDGYVTYRMIQAAASRWEGRSLPDLRHEIQDIAGICRGGGWVTGDPLGIGGLLSDAAWISRLAVPGQDRSGSLLEHVLETALTGIGVFSESGCLQLPAGDRLAFRELGLAIGLSGVEWMHAGIREDPGIYGGGSTVPYLRSLTAFLPMGRAIREYWLDRNHREARTWSDHREINTVMLAAALAPGEYLGV